MSLFTSPSSRSKASRGSKILGLTLLATGLLSSSAFAQTKAFPGALGFGADATGGRGGTVYHVTTLADSGPGSFRDAVSQPDRIIVFDVGGTIVLESAVSCASDLTIAGQSAPGGGIAIIGHEVSFSARTNEIVRFLRIRPGSMSNTGEDAINVGDGTNMIFDHCSLEFAGYNNIDAHGNYGSDAITVQNSIIGDPMSNGTEAKQGFGAHTEHLGGKFAWYYNMWVSEHNRQPLAKIDTIFVNNLEYNFQDGYTVANTSGDFLHDIINNYFVTGPTDPSGSDAFFQMDANQSIYSTGNLLDNNNDGTLNGSSIDPGGGGTVLTAPWSPLSTNATVFSTAGAARYDISSAGALPRDPLDALILSQVKTLGNGSAGTGAGTAGPGPSLYYDQTSTGLGNNGYGVINGGVPATDSDGDGMPDYWEKAVGLNYLDPSDAMTIGPDGYANIERYLNWLGAPHALTVTNTPVDVDLWQYTSGYTNASPVYSVGGASNGVVSLTSGHIAQFTPAGGFSGLGSFQFSVVTPDSAYTNTVSVLVTPQTVSSGSANLTWVGDGVSNVWVAGSGTNWFDGTNLVAFNNGDTVTFDDTGSATPPIQLSGTLGPAAIYVIANDQDYTFAGSGWLAGPAGLFKTGAGDLFVNTTNTFTGGVTIDEGTVQLGDGVSANGSLAGNITNNDTLVYDNPGNVANSVNISGSGVLIKNGSGALTLTGTQTYTNTTTINSGALQFSGAVPPSDITNDGFLVLAPSGSAIYGNSISGSGAVSANPSGALILTGTNTFAGNLTNNGGFLVLSNNAAAGAGTVVYNGGNVVVAAGMIITNNFFVAGNLANDLCMMATNTGTAVWAGNVTVGGSGQWRPGSDGGTLVFTGQAIQGSHIFIVPRGSVEFASNAVVSSTVSGFLGRDLSNNHRSARITILDNASVSMAGCSMGGGKEGSYITITLQDNGSLSFGADTLDVQDINNSAAVSTLQLDGGTLTAGGFTKTETSYPNVIAFNGGVLAAGADNSAFLPAFSASTNLVQAGGAVIDDGGFAVTIAAPLIHDPALGASPDGGLTKLGAGTLTLDDANTYNGPTVVDAGTLALGSGTSPLAATANIYVTAGALLDASAESPFSISSGQKLWGSGASSGNIVIASGAVLAPGSNSVGRLMFNNSLTLSAGSTTLIAVQPSSLTNAAVLCAGTLTEGGTLAVTNLGGAFAAGDRFRLFSAGTFAGAFNNFSLPLLTGNLAWNTSQLNEDGSLWIVSTSAPNITQTQRMGANFIASGTGGTPNWYYDVLMTTNLALPVVEWAPVQTNQFDNLGNFNFTNSTGGNAQSFYLLHVP
jgi:autotransporter-associated beta strand protein